jgi:sialate O-acetylesterase
MTVLCFLAFETEAQSIKVSRVFSDGMVVQRNEKIPVWGWGDAGEAVSVSFNGKTTETVVGKDGTWKVYLPSMKAGGPYTLSVNGQEIKDVLVGDVFLFSGQSNMELPVGRCMDAIDKKTLDYTNSRVRYLKLPPQYNYVQPNSDVQTLGWQEMNPTTAPGMGAIAYFTGRLLQEQENVPIGLVNASVGGTGVECWMSKSYLQQDALFAEALKDRKFSQTNWVDSVNRTEQQQRREWEQTLLRADTAATNIRNHATSLPWKPVDLFSHWASGRQERIHGSYWFRREIRLNNNSGRQEAILRLGAMKDADSVFVNGHFVGYTSYQYPPRIYKVPKGYLKEGANEILVKLMAENGYPNFTEGKLYQLEMPDDTVSLCDGWQLIRGAEMLPKPTATYFVNTPLGLYNAMIAPLQDIPFRAVVWYQGENNTDMSVERYSTLFSHLTDCWREQFRRKLPFVVVQLAGFMERHTEAVQHSGWGDMRIAQWKTAQECTPAALATAIDLGEGNDIHPQRKEELSQRVALQLRKLVYRERGITTGGPVPLRAQWKKNAVILTFDKHQGGKLRTASSLTSFSLAGDDGVYRKASARTIDAYSVEIQVPPGMQPTSLRYAYDENPELSLYNTEGLPTPAFQCNVKK